MRVNVCMAQDENMHEEAPACKTVAYMQIMDDDFLIGQIISYCTQRLITFPCGESTCANLPAYSTI